MSGKVFPRAPHLGHFGHQSRKKASSEHFNKSTKNQVRKNIYLFMCGDFIKKRRAQRLCVYRCFFLKKKVIKMLYKTEHNETQQKQTINKIHRKNDLLKDTMFQRHKDYYGFVKTRSFRTRLPGMAF